MGSSNTPSFFILGSLRWTSIPSRESSNTPRCFMLGTLQWTSIPSRGWGVVILLVALCWVPCDGLAFHPGGSSDIPRCFMLGTLRWPNIPFRGWGVVIPRVASCQTRLCSGHVGRLWPDCHFTPSCDTY